MFGWLRKRPSAKGMPQRSKIVAAQQKPLPRPMPKDPFASLKDQVAVVTGSTSGIGHAMAEALAERGVRVVLNGLGDPATIEKTHTDQETATNTTERNHGADMTKPDQIADMVAFAKAEFGRLDILINNAGVQHVEAIENFPEAKWDWIIAINLTATFHATKAAIPLMKANGRGRIHNIASDPGLDALPF